MQALLPNPQQWQLREQHVAEHIRRLQQRLNLGLQISAFGSSLSHLCLASSDVDIGVFGRVHLQPDRSTPIPFAPRAERRGLLKQLLRAVQDANLARNKASSGHIESSPPGVVGSALNKGPLLAGGHAALATMLCQRYCRGSQGLIIAIRNALEHTLITGVFLLICKARHCACWWGKLLHPNTTAATSCSTRFNIAACCSSCFRLPCC